MMITANEGFGGSGQRLLDALPEEIAEVCAAANDPLEIAASLEARGISSRVANDRFGESDVFSLAERLFAEVPSQPLELEIKRRHHRSGGPKELIRGAMFAAPGVIFVAGIRALHLSLPTWTFLVALTSGWAFGQAIAAIGSALAGRDKKIESLALWWMLLTASVTAGFAAIGDVLRNGGLPTIAMAVLISLYVVSCSVLLMDEYLGAMAFPLIPATIVAVIYLFHRPFHLPREVAIVVIGGAIAVTIGLALRKVPLHWWHIPKLTRSDILVSARYFSYGMLCGLATSLVIVLSSNAVGQPSVIPIAGYPVMITLGVMEWQLYSFRARAQRALRTSRSTEQFARAVWKSFLISVTFYFVTLLAACIGVAEFLRWHHEGIPTSLLAAEVFLGCTFFLGLVASTCSRLDVVLLSGGIGLLAYATLFIYERFVNGSFDQNVARVSCCVAVALSLFFLVFGSRKTIRSAFSYQ